ncbi:MAG: L,D-transpeptidase [Arachnia sp.]
MSVALLTTGSAGLAAADEGDKGASPQETATQPVAPKLSLSAGAPASAYLGVDVVAKGTVSVANATGTVTVTSLTWVDGAWVEDSAVTVAASADGVAFEVPLAAGATTAGSRTWRVRATLEGTDASALTENFTVKRIAQTVTLKGAAVRWVGKDLVAWGNVKGFSGDVKVAAQVWIGDKWHTKHTVTLKKGTTSYEVDLAYNKSTAGKYTWRVVATSGKQKAISDKLRVVRSPLPSVTAKADRTKQIGATNQAKGKIYGYDGKVRVRAQVYVGGAWKTKETTTVTASRLGTSYKITLPYAANKRGTTTWRVLVDADGVTKKTSSFKVSRVAGSIDSRCLTGRVLCISKKDRKLRWMVGGEIKKTFDVRFGSPKTPTRNGAFRVNWKSRNHVSSLYHSKMPFAMFFSGGQAVHYSSDFAARGYAGASHGCVNVRDYDGIKKLFDTVRVGDKVIVYT